MILRSLAATDFKNIAGASLEFSDGINCFLGDNGMGKSNLLDALYMLSYCRSFTGVADPALIRRGQEFAMLNARYRRRGVDEELNVAIRPGRRKSFRRHDAVLRRTCRTTPFHRPDSLTERPSISRSHDTLHAGHRRP